MAIVWPAVFASFAMRIDQKDTENIYLYKPYIKEAIDPIGGTFLMLLANSWSIFSVVPTGLIRMCVNLVSQQ